MNLHATLDELCKLGMITDQQAQESLDRLDRNKTTPGQVARYGALGAVTAPVIGAIGHAIKAKPYAGGGSLLRHVAGDAAAGALSAGAIPLIRQGLDRSAEKKTLGKYLAQDTQTPAMGGVK